MEVLTSIQYLNTLLKTNLAGKLVQAAVLLCQQLKAQLLVCRTTPTAAFPLLTAGDTGTVDIWISTMVHTLWRRP